MTIPQLEIQLIAALVASSCALCGVFLVLRKMAMMSDAISHAVLIGIVLAFFIVKDLTSPLLIIAAGLTGILTVALVELLNRTKLVKEDAAIGLVFPVFFSVAVIIISRYAGNIHLDTDAVLMGELAFAPFDRLKILGYDVGPKALTIMSVILLLNLLFIVIFYKEIKLSTFDAGLAVALGFSPAMIHYALMALVSITAVGAFDAVGSILVVAFMIGPPITAYLLTERLSKMIWLSVIIGILSAVSGYWMAHELDASISGSMASMTGVIFGLTFLFAPNSGLIAMARRRTRQRWEFAQIMLTVHLFQHEDLPQPSYENHIEHCHRHMKWDQAFTERVVKMARGRRFIFEENGHLLLTETGRAAARQAMMH